VYEQLHDATAVPRAAARVNHREIDRDAARALCDGQSVNALVENEVFDA
jgi:hypothetical protein